VIITHMEHHSNQTSWLECVSDVEIIRRKEDGLPDLDHLHEILEANKEREFIIGSFTACSNVTGIMPPYHEMAAIVHGYGGYCFVDFSASAAYVNINMHPEREEEKLDAIFFSPHKFLGGPGSSGVIIFDKKLDKNKVPDNPGGGTVLWTTPWGDHRFFDDIEVREDGTVIIDHHGERSAQHVSAMARTYDVLLKLGLLEQTEARDKLVQFITQIDNYDYPDAEHYFNKGKI